MSKQRFPRDFPPHLNSLAQTGPITGSAPLGNHPLQFENMHAEQFEQFCWWLLQRDYEIEGCQLLGGPGQAQGGIDLFGYARNDKAQLIVFECKCWNRYDPTKLRDAIDHFLTQSWAEPGTRFVLIIAQQSIGKLASAWHVARQKLRARNITGELWTGVHLTELIRLNPDVLVRFFPDATVSMYCNEWMRRVDFMAQLQKALVDDRPAIRKLAHDFLGHKDSSDSKELERIFSSESSWSIDIPWIHIDAILPSKRFSSGSVGIVVKKQTTSGLTVALSQEWLLKNLLAHIGAPAEHSFRPFIYGPVSLRPDSEFVIDLNSARLQIPVEGLNAMCGVLDKLTPVYIEALRSLEQRWGAEGFSFIDHGDNTVVAMCTIPIRLWHQMLAFVKEHDADDGDGNWHIFDANPHYLKIYTTKPHPDFERGYHAFIRARDDLDGLSYGDSVVLTWDPPNSFENYELDTRRWMQCAETLAWLREKFIPAVGQWLIEKELIKYRPWQRQTKRKTLSKLWIQQAEIWEHRHLSLLNDDRYRSIGVVATTEELQTSMGDGSPPLYLIPDQMRALYRAAIVIMQGRRGYVPYICSNLNLRDACHSHHDIIQSLEKRIQEDPSYPSAYAIRCLLSAMLEGLNDDDEWLDTSAKELIFSALKPLMYHRDIERLFKRHSRWS